MNKRELYESLKRNPKNVRFEEICRIEMASPFPGMDPFLEGEMWQEFNHTLANQISQRLLPQLRPKYVALLARP